MSGSTTRTAGVRRHAHAARGVHHHEAHPRATPIEGEGAHESEQPFEEGAHDEIDPDLRHRLISEAAYEMYTERGYVDGFDVEDWLAAEAQVEHTLVNPAFTPESEEGPPHPAADETQ